ncbi:MAG: 2-dehydropantoate 2-reductase [Proteobacteria bacterium]|nr:2-dehydropantoate 2-reductase [Pseudomonadota bacterium]
MEGALQIAVAGAGATGAYLAARLAAAGFEVTLLARGPSLAAIRERGIAVEGPGAERLSARPARVVAAGEDAPEPDLVLICLKSYDTEAALPALARLAGSDARLLCLQNGIGNEDVLARRFGRERVMPGVLYVGAARIAPGVVRLSAPARIVLGPAPEANRARAEAARGAFAAAGIACEWDEDVLASKWQKFLFNSALNPLTALTGLRLGAILADEGGRRLFAALLDEAIAAARAAATPLKPDARERVMEVAGRMDISSSMAEDLAAGRRIEIEAFSGHVRRLAREAGLETPVTDTVHALLALRAAAERKP